MSYFLNLNLDKTNLGADAATRKRPVMIFHSITYQGKRFRISTGQRIEPFYWDKDTQRVKRTRPNFDAINKKLTSQKNELEKIIVKLETLNKPIEKNKIAALLSWTKGGTKDESVLTAFSQFIKENSKGKAVRTVQGFNTTKKHLQKFAEDVRPLHFQDMNQAFYTEFQNFLSLPDNSFGFHIKNMKAFLKWATETGYNENESYRKWKITHENGKDVLFIKYDELKILKALELNERLDRVRDLFLIGCFTGFRFSDLQTLEPAHYNGELINKLTLKTKEPVKVPVIPELKELLEKYWNQGKPLPRISNQKANKYLKEVMQFAEIDREFIYRQKKGKEVSEQYFKAWEVASFHTARHTFITIALQRNVSQETVRRIVGHRTFAMMARYVQNDDDFNKKELEKISDVKKIST